MEQLPTNLTFEDSDVWYGEDLQDVEWPKLFHDAAPFVSFTDRATLLEIAGTDSMSPALLLSVAIHYKREKKNNFKTYMEEKSVKLMNAFYNSTNRTQEQREKENDASHTVSLFVDKDVTQMNELIAILKTIKVEATNYRKKTDERSAGSNRIKRGEGVETTLRLPYKTTECWMMSATHHANQQCVARSCPKSAIDMAPSLYMGYGYQFSYFKSNGEVLASHSGYIVVHSPCKLQVTSTLFTTFYSHISVERKSGEYVRVGDRLGVIQIDRATSNCNCEVEKGNTECSTGPHLHWEVRDAENKPMDLDGMTISGYKIYTGKESYDVGCEPENCRSNMTLQEIEDSCSTVFLRVEDNATFCPSVQGANWGKYFISTSVSV